MMNEYNFDEFEAANKAAWTTKLNQDLGEELAVRISRWDCERGLPLSAYFDQEDNTNANLKSSPVHSPWKYLQTIHASENADEILNALMNGADGLLLEGGSIQEIILKLKEVAPQHCTLTLRTSDVNEYNHLLQWLDTKMDSSERSNVLILNDNRDKISELTNVSNVIGIFEQGAKYGHKSFNLNGNLIQELGGGAQLEIAYILAQGVYYINELLDQGHKIEKIAESVVVSTSAGSNFFLELAKVRVIRKVMERLFEAYELKGANVSIYAGTSRLTQSALDKNTNFLRCTSEAMSVVLGGADYLTISPMHDLPSRSRIARNISNLLKEESLLAKTIDPAAGSYYIENLSEELAKNAWSLFQNIEKQGGFEWAISSKFFEVEIEKDWQFQTERIASGRRKVVGVNDFGNQDETVGPDALSQDYRSFSRAFESIRHAVERYTNDRGEEHRPIVYVYGIGTNAKMINGRFTFVTNFFSWSGIKVKHLGEGEVPKPGSTVVCCGADEDYTQPQLDVTKNWDGYVMAAGKDKPELSDLISGWVNIKSDRIKTVKNVLVEMGVDQKMTEI